jgi:uncharacterized protein (DUF927 family)
MKQKRTKQVAAPKKAAKLPFPNIKTKDGHIVVANGDGKFSEVGREIRIKSIETDIDTDAVAYILTFQYGERTVEKRVDRGDLTKVKLLRLLEAGADIFDQNVSIVINHLRNEELLAPRVNVHHQIGWGKYGEKLIYKHHQAVGIESTFSGSLAIEPQGDFDTWKNMIDAEVLGHTPLELALALGFSAVTIGFVSDEVASGSLVSHLSGDSTTGKTTAVMLAGSVAGCVDSKKNGLFGTWNTTRNALMGHLRDNHGLPVIFDEASMSGLKDYSSILYMLAEGKEKARLTKELDMRDQANWRTTILSTGEHGLVSKSKQNTGLRVRILEFFDVPWTKSAENAEVIKGIVLKNHGHAAPLFAEYLLKLGKSEVIQEVANWRERYQSAFDGGDDRLTERSSLNIAILLATAELVKRHFGFSIDLEAMLGFIADSERQSMEDRDIGAKAYSYFLEQVAINHHKFSSSHGQLSKGIPEFETVQGEHWGRWDHLDEGAEIAITKEAFKQILKDGGYEDQKMILSRWKQQGLLNCESDRHTRRRKLGPKGPTLDLYVIKVERDIMTDGDEPGKLRQTSRLPNGKVPVKKVKAGALKVV